MAGSLNQKRLAGPTQPGTTATTIYTAPANTTANPSPNATAIIKSIWLANTTASTATITLGINGTAAATLIIPAVSVPANDVKIISQETLELNASDTLQALQGTASAITVTVNGAEVV